MPKTTSRDTLAPCRRISFADLITETRARTELKPRDRDDMVSALRTLSRIWGTALEALPANVAAVKARLKGVPPAAVGLDARRWTNIKSLTLKAMMLAGLATMPGRHRAEMAPPYAALFRLHKTQKATRAHSRFFRWLTGEGIPPEGVTDAVVTAFLKAMVDGSLMTRPQGVQRTAVLEWNKAAATYPNWPQQRLTVPSHTDTYCISWETLPVSLRTEFFDGYLRRLQGGSLFSDYHGKPLRPQTVINQKCQLLEFCSAFVHGGGDGNTLTTLERVVALDVAERAMGWLQTRNGGRTSYNMNHIANLIRAIARYWVKVPPDHLKVLNNLCDNTKQFRSGLAPSVRDILRQFDSDENVLRILCLPQEVVRLVKREKPTIKTALLMQTAVAVEILVMNPVRIKNLSALRFGTHLLRRRDGTMHLIVEGGETKNGEQNEAMLPDQSVQLIALYEKDYRPLLTTADSTALFPGPGLTTKYRKTLSGQISKHVFEITGLKLTPHKFRHFLAKHYLADHPNGIGTVQRSLGHGSSDVTNRSYAGFQNSGAIRHVDEHVIRKRNTSQNVLKKTNLKTGKKPRALMTRRVQEG